MLGLNQETNKLLHTSQKITEIVAFNLIAQLVFHVQNDFSFLK